MRILHLKRKSLNFTLAITLLTLALPGSVFSQARPTTSNLFVPLIIDFFVPCANGGAGEIVILELRLHVLDHHTFNDLWVNEKSHFQPMNAEGVGLITGDMYRGTGVTQLQDSFRLSNGATHFTFINNFRIIGQGPGNNFQVHATTHTTINANGDVTVDVENTTTVCN
ncbi:MAG TPA: hypothetical protein VFR78_10260 [Pyrinomonadaceae bacterium]|nr:hypothetical protein [Pyrinomonadaceae bacterium]